MIAALFVQTNGVYFALPDVDPYDVKRDAMTYRGPDPAVCHPECKRWGRYWSGGPSAKVKRAKGDDGGQFAFSLNIARTWGGVIEHPEASGAWDAFGLIRPPWTGGWVVADWCGGWTCCVAQGNYGHRAQKMTWLYANAGHNGGRLALPSLKWGRAPGAYRLDEGFHSAEERRRAIRTGVCQRLSGLQRAATPTEFRDVLIGIARTCGSAKSAA